MAGFIMKLGLVLLVLINLGLSYVLIWEISSYKAYSAINFSLANITMASNAKENENY